MTPRKAVILAAGKGTRLLPLTAQTPKVMLPVQGRPLLEHHIRALASHGVQEIFINLHAHPARIRDYFGNGSSFGLKISYCEEPTLSGTAGALNGFRSSLTEPFLVQYGDVFSLLNVQALSAFHARCKAAATLVVHVSSHPEDSDIVVFAPGGRIKALLHKPGPGSQERFGNAGFYLLTPRVLDYVPRHEESDFVRDVFPRMLDDGAPLYAYETSDLLLDMGTPKRYRALMRRLGDS